MINQLVFTSSYNSQLGCIIAMSQQFKTKKKRNIFVIQLNTLSDKKCNYSCFEDFYSNNSEHFNNLILIKVNNSLKKLLLLFFLIFLYKYIDKSKIEIWEPRPNRLNSIFNKGVINFIKFFNNKKINYYGDGFLSLCRDKKPFWLIKDKENSNKYKINKFSNFFYFYDLENIDNKTNNKYLKKIHVNYIYKTFNELITKNEPIKNLQKLSFNQTDESKIIIFPTTTFFETGRCSLNEELDLYTDYFERKISKVNNQIIIKPHPNSKQNKIERLYKCLKDKGYKVFNPQILNEIIFSKIPMSTIPLEVFCFILNIKVNIPYKNICLTINSNASLSTLLLFSDLGFIRPFGSELVTKYIKNEFAIKRISQEEKIMKHILSN